MKVSLIVTVLNEEKAISSLLDSVLAQSRLPQEVVIVDGGSRDRTMEIIRSYQDKLPLRLLVEPGCNISQGRNRAIQTAQGEVIASTDAGVRLSRNWLEALLEGLGAGATGGGGSTLPGVVCGFFLADPQGALEMAMGATVLPDLEEIDPARFLPSSRSVAFLKEAWARVGGYPEWLDYCEDLVFDMKLRGAGYAFAWAPYAIAYFRPRSSLAAFARQYYRYARGDGKADLWRKRHALRYSAYLLGALGLAAGFWQPWMWLLPLAGAAAYLYQPYRRLARRLGKMRFAQQVEAILWVPVIRLVGDLAKMAGYPVGLWWRWRRPSGV